MIYLGYSFLNKNNMDSIIHFENNINLRTNGRVENEDFVVLWEFERFYCC